MESELESEIPNQLETTISKTASGRSVDGDTTHVPGTTPETLSLLKVDPSVQLNVPTEETEEILEDVKRSETTEMPDGVQIGTSAEKPGLVCENKSIEEYGTESGIQELITDEFKESRSMSTEKEDITCTVIEDNKSVKTTVPTLDMDTVSQEKTLVNYFIINILQLLESYRFTHIDYKTKHPSSHFSLYHLTIDHTYNSRKKKSLGLSHSAAQHSWLQETGDSFRALFFSSFQSIFTNLSF